MKRFEMIATQDFEHGGSFVQKGDRLTVRAIDAAVLKYRGRARFATPADKIKIERTVITPAPAPPSANTPKPRRPRRTRRQSQRRDIAPSHTS